MQNVFESTLNKISRQSYKSKEQKIALENIKLIYKSWKVDYSLLSLRLNAKQFMKKEFQVSQHTVGPGQVSDHSNIKILSPKQMLLHK